MKVKGPYAVINFFKQVLTIFWYLEIVLLAGVLGLLAVLIFSEGPGELQTVWPVTIPEMESEYILLSGSDAVQGLHVQLREGTLTFTATGTGYYLLKVLDTLIAFGLLMGITFLLKQIFLSLSRYKPFTLVNAHRLRLIAFLLVLVVPLQLMQSGLYYFFLKARIQLSEGELLFYPFQLAQKGIWFMPDISLEVLFAGMLVFVVAEIFRLGTMLKLDNDSIV